MIRDARLFGTALLLFLLVTSSLVWAQFDTGTILGVVRDNSGAVVPGVTILGTSVFNTRNFQTDLTAKNGETLVLGGILQQQLSDTLRKTPILGSIPGLGWAFKKKDKQTDQVELMVFLRPRVVHSEREAQKLLEDTNERFPKVKQWEQGNEIKPDAKIKNGSPKSGSK